MADTKGSALTPVTPVSGDYVYLVDDPGGTPSSKVADVDNFATGAEGTLAATALQNVVEDTTPQLGGDLDANGNTITGLDASATAKGIVELATTAETDTGTDTVRAVTPAALAGSTQTDLVNDTTPVLGGTLDAATNSVENLGAVEEEVNTVATTGATETLDVSTYGVHDCTMDQNCTFTFSNPAPSGDCSSFTLILRGAFTPTLPASVDWSGGAAPTYTTPSVYVFITVDAGTTWLGSQVGNAFA